MIPVVDNANLTTIDWEVMKNISLVCANCGKSFLVYPYQKLKAKYCGHKCYGEHMDVSGTKNPAWKGGRINASTGYILIHRPDHPNANKDGYLYEHRLVMERKIGRYLDKKERVHHANGIKTDNRIENLELVENQSQHAFMHSESRLRTSNGAFV